MTATGKETAVHALKVNRIWTGPNERKGKRL
jgi:hypothetical protein